MIELELESERNSINPMHACHAAVCVPSFSDGGAWYLGLGQDQHIRRSTGVHARNIPDRFGTNFSVTHVVAFRKGSIVVCTRSLPPPFLNLLIIILVGALMVWFVLTFLLHNLPLCHPPLLRAIHCLACIHPHIWDSCYWFP